MTTTHVPHPQSSQDTREQPIQGPWLSWRNDSRASLRYFWMQILSKRLPGWTPHCLCNKGLGSWVFQCQTPKLSTSQAIRSLFTAHRGSLLLTHTPNTHFLTGRKDHVQNEYKETNTLRSQGCWYHLQAGNKGRPKMHSHPPRHKCTATGGHK
jgi:hypothetical protein